MSKYELRDNPIKGLFVLVTQDKKSVFDENDRYIWNEDGTQKTVDITLYFESDLGKDKAKYWTEDLDEAFVFTSIDDAAAMLCQLFKPLEIQIREIRGTGK
ncbi:hypothetical protein [Rheinheimera pleomorphica]|uniref:hypothetical protein n=1 Tax=Rheinheimera pleomorphica TaxID=2703963 RepID=UPI001422CC06|nr:hypothetical protein [Rheinheimera pleomorphica]